MRISELVNNLLNLLFIWRCMLWRLAKHTKQGTLHKPFAVLKSQKRLFTLTMKFCSLTCCSVGGATIFVHFQSRLVNDFGHVDRIVLGKHRQLGLRAFENFADAQL